MRGNKAKSVFMNEEFQSRMGKDFFFFFSAESVSADLEKEKVRSFLKGNERIHT